MSVWRRKAVELFPELKQDFQMGDKNTYSVFSTLLSLMWESLENNDVETVKKIFSFSEWCSNQKSENLWNAAGVSFYEHVFDEWKFREQIIVWLSPSVIANHEGLWEWHLPEEKFKEIKKLIAKRTEHKYRSFNVGAT